MQVRSTQHVPRTQQPQARAIPTVASLGSPRLLIQLRCHLSSRHSCAPAGRSHRPRNAGRHPAGWVLEPHQEGDTLPGAALLGSVPQRRRPRPPPDEAAVRTDARKRALSGQKRGHVPLENLLENKCSARGLSKRLLLSCRPRAAGRHRGPPSLRPPIPASPDPRVPHPRVPPSARPPSARLSASSSGPGLRCLPRDRG